ncbi:MAG: response regulator transcription factor [Desulfurivibrionaceae bacterium]|nr:response regulator transcription factor [Desulfurivibrionaceae bacterium]
MTRIVIVEDHPLVLEAVKHLFAGKENMAVVGKAHSGKAALDKVRDLRPDVIILDISLPDINGLDLCPLFLDIFPEVKILFFTMHKEVSFIHQAFNSGAIGYVLKSSRVDCLVEAVEQVRKGKYYLGPDVNQAVVKGFLGRDYEPDRIKDKSGPSPRPGALSSREFQILRLVLNGSTNRKIADLLCLSPKTVEKHRANIMGKTKSRTPMDLFRFAVKNKIIDPDGW